MSAFPSADLPALLAAARAILGDDLGGHLKPDGSPYWGDLLYNCAEHSFKTMRPEDEHSALVRRALLLVDEDLELPLAGG